VRSHANSPASSAEAKTRDVRYVAASITSSPQCSLNSAQLIFRIPHNSGKAVEVHSLAIERLVEGFPKDGGVMDGDHCGGRNPDGGAKSSTCGPSSYELAKSKGQTAGLGCIETRLQCFFFDPPTVTSLKRRSCVEPNIRCLACSSPGLPTCPFHYTSSSRTDRVFRCLRRRKAETTYFFIARNFSN